MNYKYIHNLFFLLLILYSCSFDDQEMVYQERLVVFATISANLPVLDTVLVSRTAEISEDVASNELWIDDASVMLIDDSTDKILNFYNVGPGRYFPVTDTSNQQTIEDYLAYVIRPGSTYQLVVVHDSDSVIATTSVPSSMNIQAADLGDYVCPDGDILQTDTINVHNLDDISIEQLFLLAAEPEEYIIDNNIDVDTVTYRFGDCFTKSFASYPMFGIDFQSDNYQTIKILTYALEANRRGLEPLDTLSNTIDSDSGGFFDYNYNGLRDSVFINLIYDTTLVFRIWKGQYPRTENSTPYRINPWQWNIEEAPTQIMWLYFDYYGYQLMTFQATSESYFDYFSGDPVGQNIYLLPDSNLDDGLGVFYSSNASRFLVYVRRDDLLY